MVRVVLGGLICVQKTTVKSVSPISTLYLGICMKFAEIMVTDFTVVFCTWV
jgi:hypothetical protein